MFERYAVFYTPSQSDLARFGASWLGWDSATGQAVPHMGLAHPDGHRFDVEALTKTPRKYGLHATLKAPFHLAPNTDEKALQAAVQSFAASHAPVMLDGLELQCLRGFMALRPRGDVTALNALVADITRDFDAFRAPLSEADIARRRKAGLSPRQDQQMLEWGYPFIFDDFHFHITLSGKLDAAQGELLTEALAPVLTPLLPEPFALDALTLMGQDAQGLFHQLHRYDLTGTPSVDVSA